MSMSTHVKGVRDLDGQFAVVVAAKLACEKAGVGYPQDLVNYFGEEVEESEDYLRQEMETVDISAAIHNYGFDSGDGYEVKLCNLPEGIKAIRFENSW